MIRILVMLLVFSGSLNAADPQIEALSDTEFAFDLDGSRISIEIRDRVLREKISWVHEVNVTLAKAQRTN